GRVRIAPGAAAVESDRGELPPPDRDPADRDTASVARRGGGADRRPGAGVAGGPAARDRGRGRGTRGGGGPARARRQRAVPSSAGAFGGLSGCAVGGPARRASRAGGG